MVDAGLADLLRVRDAAVSPPVVCVANQKGGVGKTTVAVNLAAALAADGHSVTVVDLDPQGNATTGLGLERDREGSAYDLVMGDRALDDLAVPTAIPNLSCVTGSVDLAGAEVELVAREEREYQLARALRSPSSADVVLIDCPPSLGLLTVNALTAAPDLLVPVQCEYYALEGLGQLLQTAERVRRSLNPQLRIGGLVLTMYDARTRLSGQVADEVRKHFGERAFRTVIPRSVRLSEAPSYGEPVLTLDPSSRGAISFRLLAREFAERYRLRSDDAGPEPRYKRGSMGPGGRGYGTVAPAPRGATEAWPPKPPWLGENHPKDDERRSDGQRIDR